MRLVGTRAPSALLSGATVSARWLACGLAGLALAACSGEPAAAPEPGVAAPAEQAAASLAPEVPAPEVPASPEVARYAAEAIGHLDQIVERFGVRSAGTDEERDTAQWIGEQFEQFGLSAELQTFPLPVLDGAVVVHGERELTMPGLVQAGSPRATVTASLVDGGDGGESELAAADFTGSVLLIRRGREPLAERAQRAEAGGAAGLIVYNEVPSLFQDSLGDGIGIPVVGITRPRGTQLRRLLDSGEVQLSVRADQHSQNVVGRRNGGDPIVVLGGHYDTVPESPGANDNATGIAAMLVVAGALAEADRPYELRFIGFGAEERQLVGSEHYVEHLPPNERERIVLMLNFDSIGKGTLGINGSDEVVADALAAAERLGIELIDREPRAGTRSDHAPFAEHGITHAYFFGTELNRIHTPQDTRDGVEELRLGEAAAIALELLSTETGTEAPN